MKPHYTQAPPKIRAGIESARLHGTWEMLRVAYASGHNVLPADVPTPLSKREEEIRASGDRVLLAEFRAIKSVELADERRCLAKAIAMQIRWAHEPSQAEAAAIAAAERERLAKEQVIDQRTREILASDQMRREAKARAIAVKESESES